MNVLQATPRHRLASLAGACWSPPLSSLVLYWFSLSAETHAGLELVAVRARILCENTTRQRASLPKPEID